MTSEAHPPDDNRLDERIDAYGLGYYHVIHAGGSAHSGESGAVPRCPFDWNGPRPWSGQAPAQASAMRAAYEAGWRAGADRGWMLSAGPSTTPADWRRDEGRRPPSQSLAAQFAFVKEFIPAMVAGVLLMNLRTTWAAIAGFVGAIFRWIGDLFTAGGIG